MEKISKKRYKIITIVRDPISRNISSFFQNIEYWGRKYKIDISNCDELIKIFWKYFNHDNSLIWLDLNFNNTFGINIYKEEFNQNLGYEIYSYEKIDVLVIKLEKMSNDLLKAALFKFLDIKINKVYNKNTGRNKKYGNLYAEFKRKIVISPEYINKMYNSEYVKHFYTKEEIYNFKKIHKNNNNI